MMVNNDYFPCPVCKKLLVVELSIKDKPYCKCNDCGVQLFIRGKEGIAKLTELLGKTKIIGNSKELINTIDFYNELNDKLIEIEMKKPLT